MIVTCEACNTSFNMDDRLLKDSGSKVKCSVCSHIFVVYPPDSRKAADETETPAMGKEPLEDITTETAEVDLEDIEKMIESGLHEEKDSESGDTEEFEEFDLGMEMEMETEPAHESVDTEEAELDLSDLDEIFKTEPGEPTKPTEPEEMSIELDLKPGLESPLEEAAESGDEFDLSDLDKMLETYEAEMEEIDKEGKEAETAELELDIDLKTDSGGTAEEPETAEELDLSDLDQILGARESEEAETEERAEQFEELDFDLDFEVQTEQEPADAEDLKMEFDSTNQQEEVVVLDLEELEEEAEEIELLEHEQEAQQDLQAHVEKAAAVSMAEADQGPSRDYMQTIETVVPEEPVPIAEFEAAREFKPPKKRIGKPLLVAGILLILAAGGYFASSTLNRLGIPIQIPFISDFLQGPAEDVDRILILQDFLTSKFVLNTSAGNLFVITGQAKNSHAENRSFLKVTGKLYTKGKVLAKTQTVYCGNVLSDPDLSTLDMETITQKLQNRAGDNHLNLNVGPGQTVPFMVVFSGITDDLEEYELESAGSLPSQ